MMGKGIFITASQSLHNILPLGGLDLRAYSPTRDEIQLLYRIWQSSPSNGGKTILSSTFDRLMLASLEQKGLIKSCGGYIDMTQQGIELVKPLILESKSAFRTGQR